MTQQVEVDPVAVLHVVKKARLMLSGEEAWTQGQSARTSEGLGTTAFNKEAVCYCFTGAVRRATGYILGAETEAEFFGKETDWLGWNIFLNTAHRVWELAVEVDPLVKAYRGDLSTDFRAVIGWNDAEDRTHADVLALADKIVDHLEGVER